MGNVHDDRAEDVGRKTAEERASSVVLYDANEAVDAVLVAVACFLGQVQVGAHADEHDFGGITHDTSHSTGGTRAQRELGSGGCLARAVRHPRLHVLVHGEPGDRVGELAEERGGQAVPQAGDALGADRQDNGAKHALLHRRSLQTVLGQVERMCDARGAAAGSAYTNGRNMR